MNIVGISGQAGSGKDAIAKHLVQHHNCIQVALADPLKRLCREVFGFTDNQLWGPSQFRNKKDAQFKKDEAWDAAWLALRVEAPLFCEEVADGEGLDGLYQWFKDLRTRHTSLSPRIALQTLGTEWGRAMDEDIWISYLADIAEVLLTCEAYSYTAEQGLFPVESQQFYRGVVVSDVRFQNELDFIKKRLGKLVRVKRPGAEGTTCGVENHASETEQQGFADASFHCILQNDKTLQHLYDAVDLFAVTL